MARYTNDTDALPPALVDRCRAALGGYYGIVTIRAGGPLTPSEKRLGKALALECRAALGDRWLETRSLAVYFRGVRTNTGRMSRQEVAAVAYLARDGWGAQAIADVLGIATDTAEAAAERVLGGETPPQRGAEHGDTATGLRVLRKRLGGAYTFNTADELAAALGKPADAVAVRVALAGGAYRALKAAGTASAT